MKVYYPYVVIGWDCAMKVRCGTLVSNIIGLSLCTGYEVCYTVMIVGWIFDSINKYFNR